MKKLSKSELYLYLFFLSEFFIIFQYFKHTLPATVCRDGWQSPSIGKIGACSHHGGVGVSPAELALVYSAGITIASVIALTLLLSFFRKKSKDLNTKEQNARQVQPDQVGREIPQQPKDIPPKCPKCQTVMVKRKTKKFKYSLTPIFWACPRYPSCKSILPLHR